MSGIIKTLKNKTNDIEQNVYPKTVLEAIVDSETNETLDIILDELRHGGGGGQLPEDIQEQIDNKVNTADIVDNLESTATNLPLSANQGREVKESVDDVNAYLKRIPSKNFVQITKTTGTTVGVTHTINEDKSISLSGVGSSNYSVFQIGEAYLKANIEYILSGCPKVESSSDYSLRVDYRGRTVAMDKGDGATFTVSSDGNYDIMFPLNSGVSYEGLVVYPMIRETTVEDDTYEPYYEDAMTMVNHLNDNALVHGDVVDNLLSNRADLPLSANMGRELSETVNAHSERFRVIHEYTTFSIVKMGKIVRLVGAIELTEITQTWGWIIDFRNIAEEYKPPHNKMIKDENLQYTFELNNNGYLQSAETIPAGVYYFDVAWLIP